MKIDQDIFDELIEELDLLDDIELDTEDKVIFSPEMAKLLKEEIRKEIKNLPIGSIITKVLAKETDKQNESTKEIKNSVSKEINGVKDDLDKSLQKIREEIESFKTKIKKSSDDFMSNLLNQPWYQFGGFSPQANDLNIGPPDVEGAWRIVKVGTDLQMQRLESGVWTIKGSFTP